MFRAFYAVVILAAGIMLSGCSAERTLTSPPSREIRTSPQAAEHLRAQIAHLESSDAPFSLLITEEEVNSCLREASGLLAEAQVWFTRGKVFLAMPMRLAGDHRFEAWIDLSASQGTLRITVVEAAWDGRILAPFVLPILSRVAEAALEDTHLLFTLEQITIGEGSALLLVRDGRVS